MLSPRARVALAVEHQEPDRVPINYVGEPETNAALREYLGLADEEQVLDRLGVDMRPVFPRYIGPGEKVGYATVYPSSLGVVPAPGEDIFGVRREPVRNPYGRYYEVVYSPLIEVQNLAEVDAYPWPRVEWFDPGSLVPQIEYVNRNQEYYITIFGGCVFENAWAVRGFQQILTDLIDWPELADRIMEKITDFGDEFLARALEGGQGHIDMVRLSDDVGSQAGMLVSPHMWRTQFRPHLKRLIDTAKSYGVKVRYHSDGDIGPIIPDLIELGVDVLNPLQFTALNIGPEVLKRRYGDRLCFEGGVDTRDLLPRGTHDEVQAETQRLVRVLGAHGGYILNSVHNIQPDVPVENILAMYDTGLSHRYGNI